MKFLILFRLVLTLKLALLFEFTNLALSTIQLKFDFKLFILQSFYLEFILHFIIKDFIKLNFKRTWIFWWVFGLFLEPLIELFVLLQTLLQKLYNFVQLFHFHLHSLFVNFSIFSPPDASDDLSLTMSKFPLKFLWLFAEKLKFWFDTGLSPTNMIVLGQQFTYSFDMFMFEHSEIEIFFRKVAVLLKLSISCSFHDVNDSIGADNFLL